MRVTKTFAAALFVAANVVAMSVIGVDSAGAAAPGATIFPYSQTVQSGTSVTWGGSWSGTAPYNVTFYYGDGAKTVINGTNSISKGYVHTLVSCTGQTYTEHLHIVDHTGQTADAYAYTTVSRGNQCFTENARVH